MRRWIVLGLLALFLCAALCPQGVAACCLVDDDCGESGPGCCVVAPVPDALPGPEAIGAQAPAALSGGEHGGPGSWLVPGTARAVVRETTAPAFRRGTPGRGA